jgi:hypothetical protein
VVVELKEKRKFNFVVLGLLLLVIVGGILIFFDLL